jgi:hypothetical protein
MIDIPVFQNGKMVLSEHGEEEEKQNGLDIR